MKINISIRLALLIAIGGIMESTARGADIFDFNRQLGRGVNIIGYDPLWQSRSQARFQDKHFRLIKEAGFQHVRINLHPFRHMSREKNLELSREWWSTLDWAIEQATAQGLRAIIDFHEFHAMGDDPEGNKPKFLSFWRQVAEHYRGASDLVIFELLNEPSKKLTPKLWNEFLKEALDIVREKHPQRPVIVGPGSWNAITQLQELKLPETDRQLIVTVHYYLPMSFTHQGAAWANLKDKTGVEWNGSEVEKNRIREDFRKAADWSLAQRRPIYLGEFGAFDLAPMASRARYTDAVARTAESLGWSWAYWQFDNDFLLWDMKRDQWVDPILRALIPVR